MNKLITYPGANPIIAQDFVFMQESVRELIDTVIKALAPNVTAAKLMGCDVSRTVSGDNATYSCTAGYVWFNGEIFAVDAHSVTGLVANYCYFDVQVTYANTGNKRYPDNTYKQCHAVRKAQLVIAESMPSRYLSWDGDYITSPAWIEVENSDLTSNFTKFSGTLTPTLRYRREANYLHLDGMLDIVSGDTSGAGISIFTLPEGFRPATARTFFITHWYYGTAITQKQCTIGDNGNSLISNFTGGDFHYLHFNAIIPLD